MKNNELLELMDKANKMREEAILLANKATDNNDIKVLMAALMNGSATSEQIVRDILKKNEDKLKENA
jgi:hypothetical protein